MMLTMCDAHSCACGDGLDVEARCILGRGLVEGCAWTTRDILMVLIVVHVIAAIAIGKVHKENLIVAMLTGRKRQDGAHDNSAL